MVFVSEGSRDASAPARVGWMIAGAAAAAATAALLALAGWAFDLEVLRSILPGAVAMNPATAVAFLCLAGSLWLQRRAGPGQGLAQVLAAAAFAFGVLKLGALLLGADPILDHLLFPRKLDAAAGQPNRMAPNTALCFALLGSSLWLFARGRRVVAAQILALVAGGVALFAVLGYAYGFAYLYRVAAEIPMAFNTALAFTVAAVAVLALRPRAGIVAVIASDGMGGYLARRLLPAAIVVPAAVGALRLWGQRAGLYATETGTLLMVVVTILLMTIFVGWTARALDRADRRRKAAEEARRHLSAIIDSSDDAILGKGLDGTILSWNKGAERLYGYPAHAIVGKHISVLAPPDREDEIPALLERIRRGESVEHFETERIAHDGRIVPVSLSLSPIEDEAGRMTGVSSIARDITARKRADEKIRQLNKELEAFSYSVSHDLRAPLRAVVGFSQALLEDHGGQLDDEGRRFLGRIVMGGRRMSQLIDDLLAFSRLSRAEMHPQPVDLSALAREVERGLRETDPDREVELIVAPGLRTQGDPRLLRVVLDNLVGNAWKFTNRSEDARVELGVASRDNGGPTTFFIRDNGAGFDMRYAEKLFAPFQRLHASHEFEGTGIGLATVQRIVQRHGGRIWAEGAIGEGATFYFTLGRE